MGVMSYLRERMGKIVAIVIGLSLFAFIGEEVVRQGSSFFKDDRNELGEVFGKKVEYDKFSKKVEQNTEQFKQQSGQANINPQITSYIQENTWNQYVSQIIIEKQLDQLGLVVSPDETAAMFNGNNPDPQVVQAFGDPQTGKVDMAKLNNFRANLKTLKPGDPMAAQWSSFVEQLGDARAAQKYVALVTGGLFVNSLDTRDDYEARNKLVNFKYTTLEYASISDNKVTPTEDDYKAYYDEHKAEFKNPQELRSFEYVSFNGSPSKEDSAVIKEQVEKLVPQLKAATDDSLFVQTNAETKAPLAFKRKGQLGDPKLDSVMFSSPKGFVYGPYISNGSYAIAKLVDSRVGPDSVTARHILLPVNQGIEKALAKADSIKKVINGGKSFADMANMFSVDKNSAVKGGDLGTFGRGAMIPVFEDAVFNGKKGDIKIVTSQFGVHIIQIENQKGSSTVAKVAVIDKPLAASTKTQSLAYSRAQAFLAALTKDNFDQQAKKSGVAVKTAADLPGTASGAPGLDNARELVRWVFKAGKGDFSDQVYTVGDKFVVANVTAIKPQGTLSLDDVKPKIEAAVKKHVKAKQLTDKFEAALNGSSSIDQVAQKVGSKVVPIQNTVFANPVIPGLAPEYKLIGTMFGSQPNKLSKPVEGAQGVYVFIVDNFINPAPLANNVREKEQLNQSLAQRAQSQVFEALKDKANVKDYRSKFL